MDRLAPAKVNLYLHVGPPGGDGYHPIASLMVFADIGDRVSLIGGEGAGLSITGPFADGLAAEADNLILRARDRLLAQYPTAGSPFHLVLDKQLPIASGLGGGSADAAATLRLLRDGLDLDISDQGLFAIARDLGSDVSACLDSHAVIATGRGERLSPVPAFPDLDAVLVNPGLPSPTGAVYTAYDRAVSPEGVTGPDWPAALSTAADVADFISRCRNDLQPGALTLQPAIGDVLSTLATHPETLLGRMSGSGATCFALCRSPADATALATRLADSHPSWWVRACVLRGAPAVDVAHQRP